MSAGARVPWRASAESATCESRPQLPLRAGRPGSRPCSFRRAVCPGTLAFSTETHQLRDRRRRVTAILVTGGATSRTTIRRSTHRGRRRAVSSSVRALGARMIVDGVVREPSRPPPRRPRAGPRTDPPPIYFVSNPGSSDLPSLINGRSWGLSPSTPRAYGYVPSESLPALCRAHPHGRRHPRARHRDPGVGAEDGVPRTWRNAIVTGATSPGRPPPRDATHGLLSALNPAWQDVHNLAGSWLAPRRLGRRASALKKRATTPSASHRSPPSPSRGCQLDLDGTTRPPSSGNGDRATEYLRAGHDLRHDVRVAAIVPDCTPPPSPRQIPSPTTSRQRGRASRANTIWLAGTREASRQSTSSDGRLSCSTPDVAARLTEKRARDRGRLALPLTAITVGGYLADVDAGGVEQRYPSRTTVRWL
jgi:hypothetical protein